VTGCDNTDEVQLGAIALGSHSAIVVLDALSCAISTERWTYAERGRVLRAQMQKDDVIRCWIGKSGSHFRSFRTIMGRSHLCCPKQYVANQ